MHFDTTQEFIILKRTSKRYSLPSARKENSSGMTSCYNSFTLFAHICTLSRNRIAVRRLQQRGISALGYFFYQFLRRKGRSQSTKVTESSIFMDSAGTHVLSQGVKQDMLSDTAAALREASRKASKSLTLL